MTRNEAREAVKVLMHYIDGGEVEFCHKGGLRWTAAKPNFNFGECKYRIAQTPVTTYAIANAYGQIKRVGTMKGALLTVLPDYPGARIVKLQEVTE